MRHKLTHRGLIPEMSRYFLFITASIATYYTIIRISIEGGGFCGVKRPVHEAGYPPPPSAKFKNAWSYTSTPRYFFKL
jgi:hypothetical protein